MGTAKKKAQFQTTTETQCPGGGFKHPTNPDTENIQTIIIFSDRYQSSDTSGTFDTYNFISHEANIL